MPGLALAIALKQGSDGSFAVTVADPAMNRAADDLRASAIAAAARRLFETIGVWKSIEDGAQPILDMVVTDSKVDAAMRPTFLTFDGEIAPGEPFAHMIENAAMIAALLDKARDEGVDLRPVAVSGFAHDAARVTATLSDGAHDVGAASGGGRRRALGDPRAGRDRDPWMELRSVRHRHHGRA